jgi:hypothetical protein
LLEQYYIGLLSVMLDDTVRATESLAGLRTNAPRRARLLAAALQAAIDRHRGNLPAAVVALEGFLGARAERERLLEISNQHWGLAERFALAEMLLAMGRDSAADDVYQSFVRPWDAPFIAAARYRRGQIAQRSGDTARARFHYQRAARMWSDNEDLRRRALGALERLTAPAR